MFGCTSCTLAKPVDASTLDVQIMRSPLVNEERQSLSYKQQCKLEHIALERIEKEAYEKELARAQERERRQAAREAAELKRQQEEREEMERRRMAEIFAERRRRDVEEQRWRESERQREEKRRQEEREMEAKEAERKEQEQRALDEEKLASFLASKGCKDVNSKRKTIRKHYYPLHDAVLLGDADLVRVLLAAGANPKLKSSSGKTPLEKAKKRNRAGALDQVCEMLSSAL